MQKLLLPLVESLVDAYQGPSFSNVKIIGAQHILETTHAMFKALYRLGLKPENISIIGKCYSTCKEVYEEMIADGIDVCPGSFAYSSHSSYDEQYTAEVHSFLSSRLHQLETAQYDLIIVLDDGGKCINFLSTNTHSNSTMVAIEQTTAGYEAIRFSPLPFPVINVARSPVKLNLESPMIAQAAAERLYLSLKERALYPNNALVIGGGAIGSEMYKKLSKDMDVTVYDSNHNISSISHLALSEVIPNFQLIVGCTGKTSVPYQLHKHLSPNSILVSVSSSDREFDAVHLRKKNPENRLCHQDLLINDILLIKSGFPVNFDGDRENIAPEFIQLTIALITSSILNARVLPAKTLPQILPLCMKTEEHIVHEFSPFLAKLNKTIL